MNLFLKYNSNLTFSEKNYFNFQSETDVIKLKQKVVVNGQKISRRKWPKLTVKCVTFPMLIKT